MNTGKIHQSLDNLPIAARMTALMDLKIENKPESTTKPDDSNNSGNDNVDEQPPRSEIEGE